MTLCILFNKKALSMQSWIVVPIQGRKLWIRKLCEQEHQIHLYVSVGIERVCIYLWVIRVISIRGRRLEEVFFVGKK